MLHLFSLVLLILVLGPEAWAQSDAVSLPCEPGSGEAGQDCSQSLRGGAWGMIALGLIFFAVGFLPTRKENEQGFLTGISMIDAVQRRVDKELTGWRRFQWPVLGLFFIGLGVAYLAGWR